MHYIGMRIPSVKTALYIAWITVRKICQIRLITLNALPEAIFSSHKIVSLWAGNEKQNFSNEK